MANTCCQCHDEPVNFSRRTPVVRLPPMSSSGEAEQKTYSRLSSSCQDAVGAYFLFGLSSVAPQRIHPPVIIIIVLRRFPRRCWVRRIPSYGPPFYSVMYVPVSRFECVSGLSVYWPIIALGTCECGVSKLCRDPTVQSEFFLRVLLLKTFNWIYCYRYS